MLQNGTFQGKDAWTLANEPFVWSAKFIFLKQISPRVPQHSCLDLHFLLDAFLCSGADDRSQRAIAIDQ